MNQIERGIFKGFLHRCNHNWSLVDSNKLNKFTYDSERTKAFSCGVITFKKVDI